MKERHDPKNVSGCNMMDILWEAAKDCHLEKPGISGMPDRVSNFVTCGNIPQMQRLAALQCWRESNVGNHRNALFTPLELSDNGSSRNPRKSRGSNDEPQNHGQTSGVKKSP